MASYLSLNQRVKFLDQCRERIRNIFTNASRFAGSQRELLDARTKSIFEHVWYERATIADKEYLRGYFDALAEQHMRSLEFRYLIDGRWYTPREVAESCPAQASSENGHYVYIVNTPDGPEYRIYH